MGQDEHAAATPRPTRGCQVLDGAGDRQGIEVCLERSPSALGAKAQDAGILRQAETTDGTRAPVGLEGQAEQGVYRLAPDAPLPAVAVEGLVPYHDEAIRRRRQTGNGCKCAQVQTSWSGAARHPPVLARGTIS